MEGFMDLQDDVEAVDSREEAVDSSIEAVASGHHAHAAFSLRLKKVGTSRSANVTALQEVLTSFTIIVVFASRRLDAG